MNTLKAGVKDAGENIKATGKTLERVWDEAAAKNVANAPRIGKDLARLSHTFQTSN